MCYFDLHGQSETDPKDGEVCVLQNSVLLGYDAVSLGLEVKVLDMKISSSLETLRTDYPVM